MVLRIDILCVSLSLLVVLFGCNAPATPPKVPQGSALVQLKPVDPMALELELRGFLDSLFSEMVGVAGDVAATSSERRVRESSLRLRIRVDELVQQTLQQQDARSMFVHAWVGVADLRRQLETGELSQVLGGEASPITQTAKAMEAQLVELGKRHFPPELIDQSMDDVERAAGGLNSRLRPGELAAARASNEPDLVAVLRIPLLPVSTLQGVSSTPDAIDRFGQSVRSVGHIVKNLPERARWEAELLQWEMAQEGPVAEFLNQLRTANQSISSVAEAVQQLPRQSTEAIEQLRGDLPELQKITANLQRTTEEATRLSTELVPVANAFTATAAEVRQLLAEFRAMQDSRPPPEPNAAPSPQYDQIADSIRGAAAEVRGLLQDLRDEKANRAAFVAFESAGQRLLRTAFVYAIVLILISVLAAYALKRWTLSKSG
jgi:hypothetical protein